MTAKAAVGFDATDQKFIVVPEEQLDIADENVEGSAIDIDGRTLTILKLCESVDEARNTCEEKANDMLDLNGMGLASITYDDEPQSASSSDAKDMEQEANELSGIVDDDSMIQEGNPLVSEHYDVLSDMQKQINSIRKSVRDAVGFIVSDLQADVDRVTYRQKKLTNFFKSFALDRDGSCREDGDLDDLFSSQILTQFDESIMAHYDELNRIMQKKLKEADTFARKPIVTIPPKHFSNKTVKKPSATTVPMKIRDENVIGDYSFGSSGNPPKRIVNGVVLPSVSKLTYPFVSKEIEEDCYEQSNGQAPIYAQLLAKHLFAETIELYFKEQDPQKRNWLHDAVDYRFPTPEKAAQVTKWKNCSYFINKNMRIAAQISGNPLRPAPCGPRGPIGPKDPEKRNAWKEAQAMIDQGEENEEVENFKKHEKKFNEDVVLKEVQEKSRSSSTSTITVPSGSKPPSNFKYVSMNYERECFEESRGDQYKYAELMAMRLFANTITMFFKDQDAAKKDWLRQCVESRFPIDDANANQQRWKVCGQMCNKNRTKVLGPDGKEEEYPYFTKEFEEECYRKSNGIPSVYAELMSVKLFPDSPHLFFKDQEIGRRNWLHSILDKRFPSKDKVQQVSKWKACTNAINKKLSESANVSFTNGSVSNSPAPTLINDTSTIADPSAASTPKTHIPRFERKEPIINGSLKRRADDHSPSESPAAKRESVRNKLKKEKAIVEQSSAYPYVSEEEEHEVFQKANGNCQVYARELGKLLFKDTITLYFKDQDHDKRVWIREIIDFRFPSRNQIEQKQKWKNVTAAINRNMSTNPNRKSIGK